MQIAALSSPTTPDSATHAVTPWSVLRPLCNPNHKLPSNPNPSRRLLRSTDLSPRLSLNPNPRILLSINRSPKLRFNLNLKLPR